MTIAGMKKIAVISPLRGTPMQFAEIDRQIADMIKRGVCGPSNTAVTPAIAEKARAAALRNLAAANTKLAERLCREVIKLGHRPVAGHLFYPRFLDDTNAEEREIGMLAGRMDFGECDEAWVFRRLGISSGMADDVKHVTGCGILVYTPASWDAPS